MLHHLKNVTILIVLFIFVGCATAPKITLISPSGERIPDPYYTAGTTGDSQMRFTWYYVKYEGIKDLDGSIQVVPVHLDRKANHYFSRNKVRNAQLVLRVFNPKQEKYTIYSTKKIKYNDGKEFIHHYVEGKSFLDFRQWNFLFPVNKNIKKMTVFIEVVKEDNVIIRTRKFTYIVN